MASTSAFEIVFAAVAETVDAPADAGEAPAAGAGDGEGEGAEAPFAEPADGGGAEEPAAAVTLAACLEPKMADTMLPKTLILSSCFCLLVSGRRPGFPASRKKVCPCERHIRVRERLVVLWGADRRNSISTLT